MEVFGVSRSRVYVEERESDDEVEREAGHGDDGDANRRFWGQGRVSGYGMKKGLGTGLGEAEKSNGKEKKTREGEGVK